MSPITTEPMQIPPYSSTPFCKVNQGLMNRTFDISGIAPTNLGSAQDVATIAAEVLAAAAAQASKEFWQMQEPKITKLRSGYSADAELVFWSWWVDILANIQDRELDNKATIQLIKEQTLDTKTSFTSQSGNRGNQQSGPKPFLGKYRPSKLMAGKDGTTNPDQTCHYWKDTGHLLENCVRLEARNKFVAERGKKEKEGLN